MSHLTWGPIFEDDFTRDSCKEAFERWNELVKKSCPRDKLLVFDVREGWGPLCDFLDLPVPDLPFPHLNDTLAFQKNVESMNSLGLKVAGALALGVVSAVFVLVRLRMKAAA